MYVSLSAYPAVKGYNCIIPCPINYRPLFDITARDFYSWQKNSKVSSILS